jgi:predicted benzoate:H+ symporter BenE
VSALFTEVQYSALCSALAIAFIAVKVVVEEYAVPVITVECVLI